MKSLNTNNIEEVKGEKPKKNLKQFLAVPLMVASLWFASCESKENITKNDTDIVGKTDIEIVDTDSNLIEDKEQSDMDNEEINNDIDEITDMENEDIESDEDTLISDEDNNQLDPAIQEEFNKPCYNAFTIAEKYAPNCDERFIYTKNGVLCADYTNSIGSTEPDYVKTLSCDIKENLDKLKEELKKDQINSNLENKYRGGVEGSIKSLYLAEMYGVGTYNLIDKPDPVISNNDYVEGYDTTFTFEGKNYHVVDELSNMGLNHNKTFLIKNDAGVILELYVGVSLDFYDVEYEIRVVERESAQCAYEGKDNSYIAKYTFINADKAYVDLNQKIDMKCYEVNDENYKEYREKIINEN